METILYTRQRNGVEAQLGYPHNIKIYAVDLNEAYHLIVSYIRGRTNSDGPLQIRLIEL